MFCLLLFFHFLSPTCKRFSIFYLYLSLPCIGTNCVSARSDALLGECCTARGEGERACNKDRLVGQVHTVNDPEHWRKITRRWLHMMEEQQTETTCGAGLG